MPTILDFQIQLLSAESYSLTVCERGSSEPLASATFSHRVDFLTDFSVDRLNASNSMGKDPAERFDELQRLGRELYQKLFPLAVEQVWREHKQRSEFLILCLRFAEGATKLEVLPWETLHDGVEFIAVGHKTTPTTLTRLPLDVAPPSALPPIPRPLKLFGFFASPLDLQDHERLNAEREQEILLEAINDPAAQGRISADFEDEAKLEILERSLRAELAGSGGYHILHFTGHGISPRDGGGLLLEDAHGKKLPASIAAVMQAIERSQGGNAKLRLAVISSCQTARTLHTGAFNDLARELLRQCVPAVIAMQFSISDEGGLKFAEVLYREIAKGVKLERAVYAARCVLLADQRFFINNDALAIVLLAADGACLQTTEAESLPPQAEPGATYLGDRLDPLAHGFYGRRREYRKLRDALLHQDQRAVIIHGIGGIGKTALLTHAINRLRPRFKDVMSFDCRRAALAPETILLELHRYFATQEMPQLQSLIGQNVPPETLADEIAQFLMQLTEWPLLIVFDNFESQLDEQREFINKDLRVFLTALVRATATGSRFLFTTRVLFDLDSERLGNVQELPLGDLSRAEALMLMQKLPNLAQATHRDKLAVLEKFGGHPYALVTLDRHCSHQLLDQALQGASSLTSELREFLAIELNYRHLSDQARELLNRLAAFRSPVPPVAAVYVMSERRRITPEELEATRGGLPEQLQAMDDEGLLQRMVAAIPVAGVDVALRELIDSGLLIPQIESEELRGVLAHSIVRDFCREQQSLASWQERLRDAVKLYTNPTQLIQTDDKSRSDIGNEMEAFELLMEAEDFEQAAILFEDAHSLLDRWGFRHLLEAQHQRLLNKLNGRTLAKILRNQAKTIYARGKYEAALEQYERARLIFESMGDHWHVAHLLIETGIIQHETLGDYAKALQQYQQALEIFENLADRGGIARAHHQIGLLHHQAHKDYEKASYHYQQALGVYDEVEDPDNGARTRLQIGMLQENCRNYEAALEHYQHALAMFEKLGHRTGMARSHTHLGSLLHHHRHDYEAALEQYQYGLRIFEELGERLNVARTLHEIGQIYQDCDEYEAAFDQYQQGLAILEDIGNRAEVALSLCTIGNLLIDAEQYLEAFPPSVNSLCVFLELESAEVTVAVDTLRKLRAKWGAENFDPAWLVAAKAEVPEWLTGESEAAASE